MGNNISVDENLFRTYASCSSILVTKTLMMALLTVKYKLKNKKSQKLALEEGKKDAVLPYTADVERVKSAHLNDLENIPVFLVISGLYLCTKPSPGVATALIKAYTGARIAHTLVYAVYPVRQPARGVAFGIGFGITLYMAGRVMKHFICIRG